MTKTRHVPFLNMHQPLTFTIRLTQKKDVHYWLTQLKCIAKITLILLWLEKMMMHFGCKTIFLCNTQPKSVDQLMKSYLRLYLISYRKWGEYSKDLKEGDFRFWKHILSFYSIFHPNLGKLVQTVFSVTDNMGLWADHTPDLQKCTIKIATS